MTTTIRTFVEADVKCFHCGQITGAVRTNRADRTSPLTFRAIGASADTPVRGGEQIRCHRCGGPTYFDEFEMRREAVHVDFSQERPRRGRPPKRLVAERGAA